eukprot:scaffold111162_cov66-Attheya_sp.AAC.1
MASGNQGIPVNVSGVDFNNAIRSYFNGTLIYDSSITCWDVSEVTNMDEAFIGLETFDDALCWDVSSVTTMKDMFQFVSAFNQDLRVWNVSSVTTMQRMFNSAAAFNQDISAWDVSMGCSTMHLHSTKTSVHGMFPVSQLCRRCAYLVALHPYHSRV